MNVYTTDKIRNVVLLGHGGAGKTSLVEAMAYLSGITNRMGKISDGNTISDYDKEETKRLFSINTSVVPIIWDDVKINILDTPGYFDFVGEVEEAVSAADAAIIVVSGKNGIEVGTKKAWEICEKYKLPRMVFVTDMDIDNERRSRHSIFQSAKTKSLWVMSMFYSREQNAGRQTEMQKKQKYRNTPKRIQVSAGKL